MPLDHKQVCLLQEIMGTKVAIPQVTAPSRLPLLGLEVEVWRPHALCGVVSEVLKPLNVPVSQVNSSFLSREVRALETKYQALCRKTLEAGLSRGVDGLWEFVIPATRDYQLLATVIEILIESGCIPEQALPRGYSLHMTLGDTAPSRDSYHLLSMLEMYFSNATRLSQPGWQKKGVAGLRSRFGLDVYGSRILTHGDREAVEFRSLCLFAEKVEVRAMFELIAVLVEMYQNRDDVFYQGPSFRQAEMFLVKQFAKFGLPDENWGNPQDNPEVWERFIACYPAISADFKSFFEKTNQL